MADKEKVETWLFPQTQNTRLFERLYMLYFQVSGLIVAGMKYHGHGFTDRPEIRESTVRLRDRGSCCAQMAWQIHSVVEVLFNNF